jgi:hypothetical protein
VGDALLDEAGYTARSYGVVVILTRLCKAVDVLTGHRHHLVERVSLDLLSRQTATTTAVSLRAYPEEVGPLAEVGTFVRPWRRRFLAFL